MATEKLRYIVTADTKGFTKAMKGVGLAVAAAFAAAIKITADFEKQMSKLKAVSGATEKEMDALEKKARDLGKSTAYSASEVAGLQFELAKLGFTTNDILNSSGGILDLASALGVELADAAVLAGSTIRAFGLETTETGRVTDVLAKAASSSALDFTKLTESLKDAAPIAKLYNVSIEDTVAMLGQLANAGIHGSKAGVALRNIFIELDKKGITLQQALDKVNNSANPAATALELVGKRSAGALAIIAKDQDAVQDLADKLYNAEGAAKAMREEMEDNLIGDFDKMKSAASELALVLGQDVDGGLRDLVQTFTEFLNSESIISFINLMGTTASAWFKGVGLILNPLEALKIRLKQLGDQAELASLKMNQALFGRFYSDEAKTELQRQIDDLEIDIIAASLRLKDIMDNPFGTSRVTPSTGSSITNNRPNRKPNTIGNGGGGNGRSPVTTVNAGIKSSGVINTASLFKPLADSENAIIQQTERIGEVLQQWKDVAVQGFADGFFAMGQAINQGVAPIKAFGAAMLQTIAGFLQLLGKEMIKLAVVSIKAGKLIAAIKKWIIANPWLAVAAGAALITVAGMLSSAASKSQSSLGGGAASVTRNTGNSIGRQVNPQLNNTLANRTGGSMQLVATVRGQDLRFALQNANAVYGQTS